MDVFLAKLAGDLQCLVSGSYLATPEITQRQHLLQAHTCRAVAVSRGRLLAPHPVTNVTTLNGLECAETY